MVDEQLKSRIQKLRALADRGEGGEKETAQKKLAKLLSDNNLTEADLDSDATTYYLIKYNGKYEKRLLLQCIYKIMGAERAIIYHSKGTRNKVGIYCTSAEKLEIDLDFEFYMSLLDDEIENLITGFIQKQELFPDDAPTETVDMSKLSPEELEKFLKVNQYKNSMSKRSRVDLIESKN